MRFHLSPPRIRPKKSRLFHEPASCPVHMRFFCLLGVGNVHCHPKFLYIFGYTQPYMKTRYIQRCQNSPSHWQASNPATPRAASSRRFFRPHPRRTYRQALHPPRWRRPVLIGQSRRLNVLAHAVPDVADVGQRRRQHPQCSALFCWRGTARACSTFTLHHFSNE